MSLYQTLAEQTGQLILDGVLRPGERLPSVRQACRIHGISPVTVTQAYYLLESRGLIEARPKSGYFVRARAGQRLPEPAMSHPRGDCNLQQTVIWTCAPKWCQGSSPWMGAGIGCVSLLDSLSQ